jgi:RimJ/RimL family protein N-acetyltransferase
VHRAGATDPGDDSQFAIEALHGGMLVGSISTTVTDRASGLFSYGIGIGTPHRRCGYAGDAITILLAFMFEQDGYRQCDVSVYGRNLASLTLHGGLGFREVGRLRDTEPLRGGVTFLVLMSITAQGFAAAHPAGTGSAPPVRPGRGRHWRARRGEHWPAAR